MKSSAQCFIKYFLRRKLTVAFAESVTCGLATHQLSTAKETTGLAVAGANEADEKPAGIIYFSFVFKNKIYRRKKLFRGSPSEIKKKACKELYRSMISKLQKKTEWR